MDEADFIESLKDLDGWIYVDINGNPNIRICQQLHPGGGVMILADGRTFLEACWKLFPEKG